MRKLREFTTALTLVFVALGVATTALLLIPLFEKPDLANYFLAGVFWLSFLGEIISFKICTIKRVKYEKKHDIQHRQTLPIGLITFTSNVEATIADIVLLLSALSLAVAAIFKIRSNGFMLLIIVLIFLSMNLHCILNSRNYRYYKWYRKAIRKGVRKHE